MLEGIDKKEGRLGVALLFSLGILQIAGYWLSGALVNGDGPLAIPQPDAALYLQSARRVAEGFPFSFSEGSAVCTGSTTVLHPFLFAIPFCLGIGDDVAIACSFVLNAALYLVFLFAWGAVIRRWIADPFARILAVVLLALFGQTAYAAMALSDIGLWLAVSSLFVAGLAAGRKWLYGSMLLLGPWIRPEGMVVAIAFAMVVGGLRIFDKDRFQMPDGVLAFLGLVSMLGVFVLNHVLTGEFQFASVAEKGHFATRPFFVALYCSINDLLRMASAFGFGLTNDSLRQLYLLPVVGALAFWTGVITHRYDDWRQVVFPLAAVGALWTVATSGWQGTNADRYVAWLMPFIVLLSAEGFVWIYRRLSGYRLAPAVLLLPVLFSAGTAVAFWALFHTASEKSDRLMKFGHALAERLPKDATVGLAGNCGIAYPLHGHGIRSLYGIYSPEFEGPYLTSALETLKHRPETRFDYWFFAEDDDFVPGLIKLNGEPVLIGPGGLAAHKADWSAFDTAAASPDALAPGMTLCQRVDVGSLPEERRADYAVEMRYGQPPFRVFQHVGRLHDAPAYESGRVIWGMDSMFVALEPGKDAVVVLRTLREKDAQIPNALGKDLSRHFDFGSAPTLNVAVDGKVCATVTLAIPEDDLTDVSIRIPGSAIVNSVSNLAFLGDHIACCYWFYQ